MKRNFIALCALLLAACGSQEPKITLFSNEAFQTEADGKPVGIYTLRAGDVTMQVTNYGARVVSLWTPDRAGDYEDIVLGYETIDRYINNDGERFLGAVVGPYANTSPRAASRSTARSTTCRSTTTARRSTAESTAWTAWSGTWFRPRKTSW